MAGQVILQVPGREKPVARVDYIRELFGNGHEGNNNKPMSRGEIVKHLKDLGHETTFQVVYAATKNDKTTAAAAAAEGEGEGSEAKRERKQTAKPGPRSVVMPDGRPRAQFIRDELSTGKTRGQVAKENGWSYQIVFAASKGMEVTPGKRGGGAGGRAAAAATEDTMDLSEVEELAQDYDALPPAGEA
jgi:hypothetical protein